MVIKTQEELFSGPVNIKHISERGIKVSKLFEGEKIKAIFKGEITRKKDVVEINGKMFVEKKVECARCLDEFILTEEGEIQIFLKPASQLPKEEEIFLNFEDLNDDFYESEEFDFYDYILRLAEFFVPDFPLCSPECKGLCQKCGENLNFNKCSCSLENKEHKTEFSFLLEKALGKMEKRN